MMEPLIENFCGRLYLRTESSGTNSKIFFILLFERQVAALGKVCSVDGKILIVEVPLLYEVGWQDEFDVCVVVYVLRKFVYKELWRGMECQPMKLSKF